ncbi:MULTISPECIES: hypothetical protein [Methylocystis]|uniref:Uncharacterized protein n=1 Tax=Methylocystis rosea TaxID=173366 RepID=A0A3G8M9B7_9HYPH|nr:MULTISPECIES: hypothetical protein [Methylocystis]AZG78397.1 hypothetical protein EHO51_17640 [Methylocystis rosea]CCJ07298.1 Hypothetical protein BN69_1847 [Methylocystis sp. SC2]
MLPIEQCALHVSDNPTAFGCGAIDPLERFCLEGDGANAEADANHAGAFFLRSRVSCQEIQRQFEKLKSLSKTPEFAGWARNKVRFTVSTS